jgi:hypothetical protein
VAVDHHPGHAEAVGALGDVDPGGVEAVGSGLGITVVLDDEDARQCQTAARFRLSRKVPWLEPPSPVNDTPTWSVPRILADRPTPQFIGGPPPTMPLAPSMPLSTSAMCIEPPLPWQSPSRLP